MILNKHRCQCYVLEICVPQHSWFIFIGKHSVHLQPSVMQKTMKVQVSLPVVVVLIDLDVPSDAALKHYLK